MAYSRMIGLAALAPLALLAACGSPDKARQDDSGAMPDGEVTPTEGSIAAVDPQTFANRIAASDQFEIESAKIAQSKAKSKALRDFAAKMVTDHTASSAKLKAAATTQGLTVDASPDAQHRTDLAALRAATADDFDSLYKEQQMRAHEAALAELNGYADSGTQDALRDFAQATATVVDGHLSMLRGIDVPARNAAATGTAPSTPAAPPPAAPVDKTPAQ